jgi:hypothetical protein
MGIRDFADAAYRWLEPRPDERLGALRPLFVLAGAHVFLYACLGREAANTLVAFLVLVGAMGYILSNDKVVAGSKAVRSIARMTEAVRSTSLGARLFGAR